MQSLRWILGGVVVWGLASATHGQGVDLIAPPFVPNYASFAAYAAPACGGPVYGTMAGGCCDCSPRCCANIWDGYCQEKLHGGLGRGQAVRCRPAGCCRPQCGHSRRCRAVSNEVTVSCSPQAVAPAAPEETPPAPAPAPKAR